MSAPFCQIILHSASILSTFLVHIGDHPSFGRVILRRYSELPVKKHGATKTYPDTQCMVYLPASTIEIIQMYRKIYIIHWVFEIRTHHHEKFVWHPTEMGRKICDRDECKGSKTSYVKFQQRFVLGTVEIMETSYVFIFWFSSYPALHHVAANSKPCGVVVECWLLVRRQRRTQTL